MKRLSVRVAMVVALGACGSTSSAPSTSPPAPANPVAVVPAEDPRVTELAKAIRGWSHGRSEPRALRLLVVEASGLERLLQSTKPAATDRAPLLRRLATTYVEQEESATLSKAATMPVPPGTRPPRWQPPPPPDVDNVIREARQKAIDHYVSFITQYPSSNQLDEVVFSLAYEYELAGDVANARAAYGELIKKIPSSKFVPDAYLGLGELSYRESLVDPKAGDAAIQSYRAALSVPPPSNKVYGLALYRIGCIFQNRGDKVDASAAFDRTLEYCAADPRYDRPNPYVTKLSDITKATAAARP